MSDSMDALGQRALAAARTVAGAHGLDTGDAVVLHAVSNVLVHLRPAPVVARVMTGTVALHRDPELWLERELAVLGWLAPSRLAVAPSPVLAPGPHRCDGLWLTFTEWVPDAAPDPVPAGPGELGRRLRRLHEALRPFDGDLGDLGEVGERVRRLLSRLETVDAGEAAALAARLQDAWRAVSRVAADLPTQALHGDVSLRNLLHTPHRLVWNDFEDTFHGPVHWDLASFAGSLRSARREPRLRPGDARRLRSGVGSGAGPRPVPRCPGRLRRDLADVRPPAASRGHAEVIGRPAARGFAIIAV